MVFALLSLLAFSLVFFLNTATRWMSLGVVLLAASYPFMKRFHHLPQIHLGIAFAWAVPMAYTAQTGAFPDRAGWMLFIAAILWTTAYDTMYAMTDREEDLRIGVKSTAILFGDADRVIIGGVQVLMLLSLYLVGREAGLHWPWYAGLVAAAVFSLYQQFLIRQRKPRECFRAFLNNNYLGMTLFIAVVVDKALF
jgi:4-hydroxybenzoate polyprenyltransferase